MPKIRCAVIGVGYLGTFHAEKLNSNSKVELVGICDQAYERALELAPRLNAHAYPDYQSLIGHVDAVSIVTPTMTHYEIAQFFLQHKIHVFIEKPMTSSLEQAQELIELAEKHHCILQVGHIEHFNPVFVKGQNLINKPHLIEASRLMPLQQRNRDVSVVLDLMIHDIGLIQTFVDSEVEVMNVSGRLSEGNIIDEAHAHILFQNGCIVNLVASRMHFECERIMRIVGDQYSLLFDFQNKKLIKQKVTASELFEKEEILCGFQDALYEELNAFIDSIVYSKPVLVSGLQGKKALELALYIDEEISKKVESTKYGINDLFQS